MSLQYKKNQNHLDLKNRINAFHSPDPYGFMDIEISFLAMFQLTVRYTTECIVMFQQACLPIPEETLVDCMRFARERMIRKLRIIW